MNKIINRKTMIKVIACLCAISFSIIMIEKVAKAEERKSVETTKTFYFGVPEGGWSTAKIKLTYIETYSLAGSKVNYNSRTRIILFHPTWATAKPSYSFGTCKHSNGKSFTSWQKDAVIHSTDWESASAQINRESVTYKKDNSITGTVNASVYCSGALVPTQTTSVSMKLNVS
ncbi:MAG: hypothetical protein ACI4CS_10775 [Candidatus Weimeria sp.]